MPTEAPEPLQQRLPGECSAAVRGPPRLRGCVLHRAPPGRRGRRGEAGRAGGEMSGKSWALANMPKE